MMKIHAHGRITGLKEIATKSGTRMAGAQLAVFIPDRQHQPRTNWLGIVALGTNAASLLAHGEGRFVTVYGDAQLSLWSDKTTGEPRQQLEVIVSSVAAS